MVTPTELRLLIYFVKIVEARSIRGAASRLSLTPSVLSKALADLEERIGVSLVNRTTRTFRLTEVGKELYQRALETTQNAEAALAIGAGGAGPVAGSITVTASEETAMFWLYPAIKEFREQFPELRINIDSTDQRVDLLTSECELAYRASFSMDFEGDRETVATIPLDLVASPEVVRKPNGDLQDMFDSTWLITHSLVAGSVPRLLVVGTEDCAAVDTIWPKRWFSVSSKLFARDLAIRGDGIVLLMRPAVEADLAKGDLVRVLPNASFGCVHIKPVFRDPFPSKVATTLHEFISRTLVT